LGAGAAVARGMLVTSWSDRQETPGLTVRTIWSEAQVFVYRLPQNVTHTGDLHVELTYAPADNDCFIYLLGPVAGGSAGWQVCPGTYGQGFLGTAPGRQVIDYEVTDVLDDEEDVEGVRGDVYYVVVQAANATSRFRLSGYTPRTVAGSADTTSEASFSRAMWQTPAKARAWKTVTGAPYGGPFDITPTSKGTVECRLQYPADVRRRTLAPTTAAMPAAFEQYVYPPLWEADSGAVPLSQTIGPAHWDLLDNRHAAAPLSGGDWCGLLGCFSVVSGGAWEPHAVYHYVPVLWLASSTPYALAPAPPGPPATGLRTVGFRVTILIPQNLRLASATRRVRRGGKVVLKGTLAIPAAVPASPAAWAPPGTVVMVQKKAGPGWVTARKVKTRADGAWKAVVRVNTTTRWRVWWPGAGDAGPETSVVKKTVVRGT